MERIDLSLKTSEDSRFRRKLTPMIKQLLMETHFKKAELICILTLHYKICQVNGVMFLDKDLIVF